jgi:hypothetical protein
MLEVPPSGEAVQAHTANLRNLLPAERSLAEVKKQLITTWMDYQMARAEFYAEMGLAAP